MARIRIIGMEDVARRLADRLAPMEAAAGRRLCAHAEYDGEGMHWLEPGEVCRWRETLVDAEIDELEQLLAKRRGLGGERRRPR